MGGAVVTHVVDDDDGSHNCKIELLQNTSIIYCVGWSFEVLLRTKGNHSVKNKVIDINSMVWSLLPTFLLCFLRSHDSF